MQSAMTYIKHQIITGIGTNFSHNLFLLLFFASYSAFALNNEKFRNPGQIDSLYAIVEQEHRFNERIDTSAFFNLPAGILASGKDPAYALIISAVDFEPGLARFDACLRLTNPADGTRLYFEAHQVPFSLDEGIAGPFELMLVEEVPLDFIPAADVRILAGSYVSAGCSGFESVTLFGKLSLQPGIFVPVDEEGNTREGKIETTFRITTSSLNDLLADISLSPFQLRNLPDFTFICRHIVIDMSDKVNPAGFFLPLASQEEFPGGNTLLWQGIYVGEAEIVLGKKFRHKSDHKPPRFGISGLYTDHSGFTGNIEASSILSFDEGDMHGWDFSVDNIKIAFRENRIKAGKMEGRIRIPSLNMPSGFAYAAIIDASGRYVFSISTSDSIPMRIWGEIQLILDPTSQIIIEDNNDTFLPVALLNGKMSVEATCETGGDQKLQLTDLRFQNMRIATREPYFSIEYLSLDGSRQGILAGFPLTINHIGIKATHPEYALEINASVNLLEQEKEGFAAQTSLLLVSSWEKHHFTFRRMDIGELLVAVYKPSAFEMEGRIRLYSEDPVYGSGFSGNVHLKIADKFLVDGMAVFGNNGRFRYYCADVLFSSPIGIQAGPITINQLGGGIYCRMKQKESSSHENPGIQLPSELVYVPDKSTGLGLIMQAGFFVAGKSLLSADTRFEISFNTHGGINRIGFDGAAECLTSPTQSALMDLKEKIKKAAGGHIPERNKTSMIAGSLSMEMDFTEHSFHADARIYINVAGTLHGDGPENLAGRAILHIAGDDWYLYIGTVQSPVGLNFADFGRAYGYFMAGKHLPDALPMNRRVAEILNLPLTELQKNRNSFMLETAKGVMFGSGFDFRAGGETKIVYGYFDIGAGFDLMLTNYGREAHCSGHAAPLGINGWYAQGQMYGYLLGRLGVIINVFKKPKKFDILNIAGAALMEARGPNPMYLKGTVGGKYNILGGMIKGYCRFEIEAGEKCEVVVPERNPANMELIGNVTPVAGSKEVDVCITPRVVFNLPVNTEIKLSNEQGLSEKYRIRLEKCTLLSGTTPVAGAKVWNQTNDVLVFETSEILDPSTNYTFEVTISFEEWKNGQWQAFTENGKLLTETRQVTFTTGPLPKEIPADWISYSYPLPRMMNLYTGLADTGYIVFNKGLRAYFSQNEDQKQVIRFLPISGSATIEVSPLYKPSDKTVFYPIPGGLKQNTVYQMKLVNIPQRKTIDSDIREDSQKISFESDSITVEMRNRSASSILTRQEEAILLRIPFRTSRYKSLEEKVNTGSLPIRFLLEFSPYIYLPGASLYRNELFDRFELNGSERFPPLVQIKALPDETPWYIKHMRPTIYEDYPLAGKGRITWRSENPLGIPPVGEIQVWQENYNRMLAEEEETTGQVLSWADFAHIMYLLPYYWSRDYSDIRNQLANACLTGCPADEKTEYILKHFCWPVISKGDFPVALEYYLPGKDKPVQTLRIVLQNPFEIPQPPF